MAPKSEFGSMVFDLRFMLLSTFFWSDNYFEFRGPDLNNRIRFSIPFFNPQSEFRDNLYIVIDCNKKIKSTLQLKKIKKYGKIIVDI